MALVAGLVLTAITFLSVEPAFRVLSDETNQLDTSLSLYLDKMLRLITQGSVFYGSFHTVTADPTHRGGLFPFCISILHTLFGYSGYHGFVVNFIASALTLAVVVRFGQKVLSQSYGLIAAVLLASFPLYALSATSSAWEPVNTLLITLVLYQLHRFLERPDGPQLEVLLLLTVLASQCRQESAVLVLPVAAACYWKRHDLATARLSWRLAVIPLLFLPAIWQRIALAERGLGPSSGHAPLFSLAYVGKNAMDGLEFLLNPAFKNYPSSPVVFVLACVGAGLLLKEAFSRNKPGPLRPAFYALAGLGLGAIALVHLVYVWGDIRHPVAVRFATSYLTAMCLAAAYPLYRLCQRPAMAAGLVVALAGLLCHGLNVAARNEHGGTLTLYREYKRNLDYLKSFPKNGTLVIVDRPGQYVAHHYGAVNFAYANSHSDELLSRFKNHLYTDVVVIQKVQYRGQQPVSKLSSKFSLAPIHEYQNAGDHFIRISKLQPPALQVASVTAGQPSAKMPALNAGKALPLAPSKSAAILTPRANAGQPATGLPVELLRSPGSADVRKARVDYLEAQKRYMEAMKKVVGSSQPAVK